MGSSCTIEPQSLLRGMSAAVNTRTTPGWAIPAGATSFPLRPGDFRAGEVNLTGLRDGMDLLPHQTRHSLYLAGGQELGGRFELDGELRYAHRTSDSASS